MKNLCLLALVIAPFVAGCDITTSSGESEEPSSMGGGENPSSSNYGEHSGTIDTAEMRASMSAQSDGTTLKIYAAVFDSGTSEGIQLDTGDFFTVSTGGSGDPLVLVYEPSNDAIVHYSVSLPAPATAQDVVVSFIRQNGGVSAPYSIIHVPPPFSIVSKPPASLNYGDALSLQVSPVPTDEIEVEASGPCLIDGTGIDNINTYDNAITFDDAGNGTFSTSWLSLDSYTSDGSATSCAVSIDLVAVHDGALDPAFGGGVSGYHDIEGTQIHSLQTIIAQPQTAGN